MVDDSGGFSISFASTCVCVNKFVIMSDNDIQNHLHQSDTIVWFGVNANLQTIIISIYRVLYIYYISCWDCQYIVIEYDMLDTEALFVDWFYMFGTAFKL